MNPVQLLSHAVVARDLAHLRAKSTEAVEFRAAVHRIARALALHCFADLQTEEITVETPLQRTRGVVIRERVALVPILRAGLGFVAAFLEVLPEAKVCHIGMVRDEVTLQPTVYLEKLETLRQSDRVVLLDPMLATGGSAVAALQRIGRHCQNVQLACLIAAPEGIERVLLEKPQPRIHAAAIDERLDERGFIRPGLGDAGDRLFDT